MQLSNGDKGVSKCLSAQAGLSAWAAASYMVPNSVATRAASTKIITKYGMTEPFAAILICLLISGCGKTSVESNSPPSTPLAPAQAVVVVQKPIYVEHGNFIEHQNAHSSRGLTEWFFHCYPDFVYSVATKPITSNEVTITVTKVTLTISCPITVRVGKNGDIRQTEEHENGHVEIVKKIYAGAGNIAKEACKSVIGKKFNGTGTSTAEATTAAVDLAAREVCKKYTEKTVLVVNELSKNYDDITQHGYAKIPVPDAIKLARERYEKSDH
ncbi:MAG: hypothetical protein JST89_16060 [Cyanobacteria bacterium SZAS-4]|nr:hypothetical protein [Cyanobacteria bacterium SZAS-4]